MPSVQRVENPSHLIIGEVLRPHGIHGEVRVRILTDHPERIAQLGTVYLGSGVGAKDLKPYSLEKVRLTPEYGLFKFHGIDDRNAADRLRQRTMMIDIENAVPLEAGEFFLYQLIGLNVLLEDGRSLGHIAEVIETGANDVYVIKPSEGKDLLIPAIPDVVLKTDVQAGTMLIRPLPGLLEEPARDEPNI